MDELIRDGDHVIIDENSDKKSIHHMRSNLSVKIGKGFVKVGHLIGTPWGASYQLSADGKSLERLAAPTSIIGPKVEEVDKDNSSLFDQNDANQALKQQDIEAMKTQGKAGDDIIDALCKSSATFDTKTEYAQHKYKKRKARKYLVHVTVRRPTARLMCQAMFDKLPAKVWNLRPDTLGILLSLANVAAHSRVLVLESCQGLVAAAVAERLGGYGTLCCVSADQKPAPLDSVRTLNLTPAERAAICCAPLASLLAAKAAAGQPGGGAPDVPPAEPAAAQEEAPQEQQPTESMAASTGAAAAGGKDAGAAAAAPNEGGGEPTPMAVDDQAPSSSSPQQQDQEQQEQPGGGPQATAGRNARLPLMRHPTKHSYTATAAQQQQMVQPGFNSAILACPLLEPHAALEAVWPLLAPSATFVVFSPWLGPLAETMQQLTTSKRAVMLALQESWLRAYQVLPGRSHPHMNMTTGGTGGYLLSGIKVVDSLPPVAAAAAGKEGTEAGTANGTDAAAVAAAAESGGAEGQGGKPQRRGRPGGGRPKGKRTRI